MCVVCAVYGCSDYEYMSSVFSLCILCTYSVCKLRQNIESNLKQEN